MDTYVAKPKDVARKWLLIDAEGKVLGKLAAEVAGLLRGKHKPEFSTHTDVGDHVIVVNAEKVVLTGRKMDDKIYRRHSGYPGGFKEITARSYIAKMPERVVELAVKGMLPKNSLGRVMFKKLKVYKGPNHKQQSQKPVEYKTV